MDRGEVERFGSESVGQVDADGGSANGEMDNLAQRGVGEVFKRQRVVRLRDLLGGSPGGYPVWSGLGLRLPECCSAEENCDEDEAGREFLCE